MIDKTMIWTAQTPMVEGVYWWRYTRISQPEFMVVLTSHLDEALYCGTWANWRYSHIPVSTCKGEWAGPIPKPEER